jgi:propionate CoA-transferase
MTAREAINQVQDGDFIGACGFQLITVADELIAALEERFLETGSPRDLTIMHTAGQSGLTRYAKEGMLKRYITGHFGGSKPMMDLARENKVEIYNLPQGVICHLYRAAAAGKGGELTKVGLNTFVDPRLEGGKITPRTTEDIVHLVEIMGEEYLFFDAPKVNIALIRGTTADEIGNISMEEECGIVESLDLAMAVKANGGKVFVQVKNYIQSASMRGRDVVIPGNMVDAIIVTTNPAKHHMQTPATMYSPAMAGYVKVSTTNAPPQPLSERKIIARRAALELKHASTVNLGIGIPEMIGSVAGEEDISDELILTIESGFIGGMPVGGMSFGSAVNHWAAFPMTTQFDFYNGGGLKMAFLGFAEIGPKGDVNSSKFGGQLAGCGGFIDISQFTPHMVFCGTLTAGGLEVAVEDGKLKIVKEGSRKKLLKEIEQITFSSEYARKHDQEVMVVTERCVFQLTQEGFMLSEVAEGIDIQTQILDQMEFMPIVPADVKIMDPAIFREGLMGLKQRIKHTGE